MKNIVLALLCSGFYLSVCSQTPVTENPFSDTLMIEREIDRVTKLLTQPGVIDSLIGKSLTSSNLLKALDNEIDMYQEEYLQKKRLWYSSFRLGVSVFSANTTLSPQNESVTTIGFLPNVGLNLTIDPERLVNRKSYMRQALNKKEYSEYYRRETEQDIKSKVISQYFEYIEVLETVHIRMKALQNRKEELNFLKSSFSAGESDYQQILILNNQIYLAEETLMKATIQAKKKKAEIDVILGNL